MVDQAWYCTCTDQQGSGDPMAPDRGLSSPYLGLPRTEHGIFCMQYMCPASTLKFLPDVGAWETPKETCPDATFLCDKLKKMMCSHRETDRWIFGCLVLKQPANSLPTLSLPPTHSHSPPHPKKHAWRLEQVSPLPCILSPTHPKVSPPFLPPNPTTGRLRDHGCSI